MIYASFDMFWLLMIDHYFRDQSGLLFSSSSLFHRYAVWEWTFTSDYIRFYRETHAQTDKEQEQPLISAANNNNNNKNDNARRVHRNTHLYPIVMFYCRSLNNQSIYIYRVYHLFNRKQIWGNHRTQVSSTMFATHTHIHTYWCVWPSD